MSKIKFINWRDVDLSKWLEAKTFGPLDDAGKPMLRGSLQYDPPRIGLRPDNGFVTIKIDYTDPKCPFRIEFTEDPWMLRLPEGTEDIYSFAYLFPKGYKKDNVLTPKSIFQMYCRDSASNFGEVMFQLELTGKSQEPNFAAGAIQVIHSTAVVKYRKATTFTPKEDELLMIKIRVKHGMNGSISCELNGTEVYNVAGPTVFAACPVAIAQPKFGIYDHMINNEGAKLGIGDANRKKYLAIGVNSFDIAMSPVTIARRLPTEPAFDSTLESLISPTRLSLNYYGMITYQEALTALQAQYDLVQSTNVQLSKQVADLQGTVTSLQSADAAKATQLLSLQAQLNTAKAALTSASAKVGDLKTLLDGSV